MKAAQITEYGSSDKLIITTDAPKPEIKPDQIVVNVYATSINPIDIKTRQGYLQQMLPLKLPATLGGDFAGIVAEVGEQVKDLKIGDQVFGNASQFKSGSGAWAEMVAANAVNTSYKPASIDFNQSAALPLVGTSAIQAIEEHLKLSEGQQILIHGGAGGIGSLAIQLAKMHGAFVATTVSAADKEFVEKLGADQVIDYKAEQFEDLLHNFDAVFDTVGGETTNKSLQVLKSGGILVSMAGQPDQEKAQELGVTALTQSTRADSNQLKRLAELVDSGKLKPQIDQVFLLDQIEEANNYQEQHHPHGKVIVSVKTP